MTRTRSYTVYAVLTITPGADEDASLATIRAGVMAALRAGVRADVESLDLREVAAIGLLSAPASSRRPRPDVRGSSKDEIVDQYQHAGMDVRIYQNANTPQSPRYFAVVLNPAAKQPTGAVLHADDESSFEEIVEMAERRADQKAELLARQQRKAEG